MLTFKIKVISVAAVIAIACVSANDEDKLVHCNGKELVLSSEMGGLQANCTSELPEGHKEHCKVLCMLKKYKAVDADGKPDKALFDKLVDEKFHPDLKIKVKELKCFDHAAKIEKSDDVGKVCESAKEFDNCFSNIVSHLCGA